MMSYVVLALGVFLSLCGAIAAVAGYGIIEVERGWATFIAGSMAFSCGIVTLALGLILHTLSSLHMLLKSAKAFAPPLRELSRRTPGERYPGYTPETSMGPAAVPPIVAAPTTGLRSWPQRPMRSNLAAARNFLKSRGTVLPAARKSSDSDCSSQSVPPLSRGDAQTTAEPPSEQYAMPTEVAAGWADTRPASAPAQDAPAEFSWRADSEPRLFDEDEAPATEKKETPPIEPPFPEIYSKTGKPEAQSKPGAPWPAETVALDRLFEEEFLIELDPAAEPRTEGQDLAPEPIAPASQDHGPPPASEAVAAAVPEPSLEPTPPAADTGREELAIVGQYESAGTSYVMYSDGSIEARTAHAVFHFNSMTELKTFLDSEAQSSQE